MPVLVSCLVALVSALLIVPSVAAAARRRHLLDVPNARSSHKTPTPRIGGIGVVLGTVAGVSTAYIAFDIPISGELVGLLGVLLFSAAVGTADDILQLNTGVRLLLYLLCAAGTVGFGASAAVLHLPGFDPISLGTVGGAVFSVLFIAWYTNLFNFMDGINGIAASTSLVTMGALTLLYWQHDRSLEAAVTAGIAAASLGFLFFNFPKASVFMGDGGAVFIGLAAGALSLRAVRLDLIGTHGVVLLMFPFVFDATFTLIRRAVRKERFWAAHRSHIYQQLCDLGFSHTQVTGMYFGAALVCAALGLAYYRLPLFLRFVVLVGLLAVAFLTARYIIVKNTHASQPSQDSA